jgi:hypothetical protein
VAVGGGFVADGLVLVPYSAANTASSFSAIGANLGSSSATLTAQAICASGPGAKSAKSAYKAASTDLAAAMAHLRAVVSAGSQVSLH